MRWSVFPIIIMLTASAPAIQAQGYEQESFRSIPYYDGPDADPVRHLLDVHVPKGKMDFPVLFFVHGGGWVKGNKDHLGIYTVLARTFNRHGIGVVCPNYRLSPEVKHPEHARDVARAFAWTYRNIRKYGGRSDELFVSGHSAGGHLCALLATDSSYLTAEGLPLQSIRGAVPVSGVFIVPTDPLFDVAFGKDPALRSQASPISHVHGEAPPFLVLFAEKDLPFCDRPGATAFCKALEGVSCEARMCEVPARNHLSILWSALSDSDPVTQSMLSFIMAQVVLDGLESKQGDAIDEFGSYLARYIEVVVRSAKRAPT